MTTAVLCLVALSVLVGEQNEGYRSKFLRSYETKFNVCLQVAERAVTDKLDPVLAVAVARVESGFKANLVSSKGALGPLQVMEKHACTKWRKGCVPQWPSGAQAPTVDDLIEVGVGVLKALKRNKGSVSLALCHYNQGTICGRGGRLYAKRVQRYMEVYRHQVSVAEKPIRKRRLLRRPNSGGGRDIGR